MLLRVTRSAALQLQASEAMAGRQPTTDQGGTSAAAEAAATAEQVADLQRQLAEAQKELTELKGADKAQGGPSRGELSPFCLSSHPNQSGGLSSHALQYAICTSLWPHGMPTGYTAPRAIDPGPTRLAANAPR